ncbi:ABC transporter ATP-binding protein [Actinopolymorpha alba]|uniref:ABC transporter ATP-binding protein n=1 Tax=Actinopolymorpha alba TaxID=533267 RepID=UPI000361B2D1|nr:ATP-binding cassette domain-containing protein [Actinopolymorpha alba]
MRLIDIYARYHRGGLWVLRGVDVELRPGETVVITGRNGAGKSTLLRVAAGLLRAGRGQVRDRPAVVGWLPERFPAGQPFDVRDYLQAMARVQGLTEAVAEARIMAFAARLHLAPFLRTPLRSLSQGTQRKVALTQALLPRPGLLIMDEPWEGLDAPSQAEIPALVAEQVASGGICLITDHRGRSGDLGSVRRLGVEEGQVNERLGERVSGVVGEERAAREANEEPNATTSFERLGERVSGVVGEERAAREANEEPNATISTDMPASSGPAVGVAPVKGGVTTTPPGRHVIEVVVQASDSPSVVASLRAAGYDVRAVRGES